MKASVKSHLSLLCHPYMFALKEGRGIGEDLMDYSLLLLQRNCIEVMHSPTKPMQHTAVMAEVLAHEDVIC